MRPFREIRAIYSEASVRVYQAYSDEIADLAVAANSFSAPLAAGCWSSTRMTWIKPSAVWMAYRCGWTTMKDKKQARVLALDLSRERFEKLLMAATLSHGGDGASCKESTVVVQWDPERDMDAAADAKEVLTRGNREVRSIQIGLRGRAVEMLLDPTFVLRIEDVTGDFRNAQAALAAGDATVAAAQLWPREAEIPMELPTALRAVLAMEKESEAPPHTTTEGDCLPPKRLRSWGEQSLKAALPAQELSPRGFPKAGRGGEGGEAESVANGVGNDIVGGKGGGKVGGKGAARGKAVNHKTVSRWVQVGAGRLTASGAPSAAKLHELRAEMGVSHVVTLLRETESQCPAVRAACARLGLGWTHLPLSGAKLADAGDKASIERIPELVALLAAGESVLVHCAAGMHRTGISCYIALRLAGWSVGEAVDGVRAVREITHDELVLERRGKPSCQEMAEAFVSTMLSGKSRQIA